MISGNGFRSSAGLGDPFPPGPGAAAAGTGAGFSLIGVTFGTGDTGARGLGGAPGASVPACFARSSAAIVKAVLNFIACTEANSESQITRL